MIDIFRANSCEGSNGITIRIPRPPSERAISSRATMSDGPSPTPFQKVNRPIVKSQSLTTSIDKLVGDPHYRASSVCSSCRSYFRSRRTPSTNSVRSGVKGRPCIHESNNKNEIKKESDETATANQSSSSSSREELKTKCLNCRIPFRNSRSSEKVTAGSATDKSIKSNGKRNASKNPVDKFPTRNGFPVFNTCMSLFQVQENLRKGELIEGILLINPKKYEDAYITAPALLGRGDGHLYWRDV